jgi:hypothetical protein
VTEKIITADGAKKLLKPKSNLAIFDATILLYKIKATYNPMTASGFSYFLAYQEPKTVNAVIPLIHKIIINISKPFNHDI